MANVDKFKQALMKPNFVLTLIYLLQKVRNIKKLPVDRNAIMDGLSSLLLSSQKPMFSEHVYASVIVV